jgi:hypothetical protein
LDSTKLSADASGQANRTYEQIAREVFEEAKAIDAAEDELYGDARGDELPPELADPNTRKQRLRRAKAELEAEWEAERQAREAMLERRREHEARTGRRPPGRPPGQRELPDRPRGRRNITDVDSRSVKTPRGFIQGYNAHAIVGEDQIILAADLTNRAGDGGMLEPMIDAGREQLAAIGAKAPDTVLADAGYWNADQIQRLADSGMTVLVPPDGHTRAGPPIKRGALAQRMRDRLAHGPDRDLYRRRQTMIEPIFGHTKHNRRAERFKRRGLAACQTEWRLLCATHNLLKLWRHTTAAPATA